MRRALLVCGRLTLVAINVFAALRPRRPSRASDPLAAAAQRVQGGESGRRQRWFSIAMLLAALAAGGLVIAALGVMPLKASSGHWPITAWFLHFAMRRSAATHSLGLQIPALDDPRLVLQGAGHYETGCRHCHGSPALPHPRIPQYMTPHPPYLPPQIATWEPEEIFYIVKHGVKFTGMPAWPAPQRDDEVWAMVAFLLTLPHLQAEDYRRLVHGEPSRSGDGAAPDGLPAPEQVPQAVTANCARCHGIDGHGRGAGAFPRLAGQRPVYLEAALQAYVRGQRQSGIMAPVAAELSGDEMRALAHYYGTLPGALVLSSAHP